MYERRFRPWMASQFDPSTATADASGTYYWKVTFDLADYAFSGLRERAETLWSSFEYTDDFVESPASHCESTAITVTD